MKIESEKLENSAKDEKFISANGKEVFVTPEEKKHLLAHPDVVEYLEEAISNANITEGLDAQKETVNMRKVIGISALTKTNKISPDDETDFAGRIERKYPVRVVLDAVEQSSDLITIKVVFNKEKKKYFLQTAWVGPDAPSLPYNVSENTEEKFKESLDFWCDHALAYNPEIMGKPFKSTWNNVCFDKSSTLVVE